MLHTLYKRVLRALIMGAVFFLPEQKKIAIERKLRGKEEFRKLQKADCVVVSFGKSGRTWLRVMLSRFYQIKHGLPENSLIGFDNLHARNAAIPRIFFTHDNYLKDYTGHADSKQDYYNKKVVLLVRDPRDVVVSQFFQWKHRMRPAKKRLNLYPPHEANISEYEFALDQLAGLPKIVDYFNLWATEADKIDQLLIVRYEDMRRDTAQVLQQILEFIGTPASAEQARDVVEFSSIENMKKMEQKRTFWLSGSRLVPGDRKNPESFKVRRGKVGGFKDYFDETQVEHIENLLQQTLQPVFGYTRPDTTEK
ncbi:MAG: sulfotransferase domain-containing protein [gamma proteobacterium symbiont of Bathyaustriella thionipta]|nr:sulfotransferase domain-containing protein [gamma proteobacterium symbiont of Bathyaustriella thionipta]